MGFPGDSVVKNSPTSAGDTGSILGSGRSPEKEMATHFSTYMYLALQKLSSVLFQRHRLNGIIVFLNTVALGESLANILTIRY